MAQLVARLFWVQEVTCSSHVIPKLALASSLGGMVDTADLKSALIWGIGSSPIVSIFIQGSLIKTSHCIVIEIDLARIP